ncbi:MAG: MarR family transcriptional regulator [Sphingomonadales bacterium]|nr:MarR family transcriptional regulator [Sphingomonadales bacterium]MDE2171670.1 MarR family transcriptional regulator [Sphingomonadales bacterium]
MTAPDLTDEDYAALADFRNALRQFQAFSEDKATAQGLTPQQHQALLAIRGAQGRYPATVGFVADRLILKPHSATGLIDRLVALDLVERQPAPHDRRQTLLVLTPRARAVLAHLSATHREEIRRLKPLLATLLAQLDAV